MKQFPSSILFLTILSTNAPLSSHADRYVSTTGDNVTNSGTSLSSPYRTIKKGVISATAGETVHVLGGEYREEIIIQAGTGGTAVAPVVVQPYDSLPVYVKGSEVMDSGWVLHSGNIYKKTGVSMKPQQVFLDFDNDSPTSASSLKMIGTANDLVSYDPVHEYVPVGANEDDLIAGSFYWSNADGGTLYVWLPAGGSPNGRYLEVSARKYLILSDRPYITFKSMKFRHSNTAGRKHKGAAIELGQGNVVEDCDIQWCDFAGLGLSWNMPDSKVINSVICNNGALGIQAPGSPNFLIQDCIVNNNNYRNFGRFWHAGGIKATTNCYGTVENCEVGSNNGSGIWFDDARSSHSKVIRNNYVHDNGPYEAAIMYEISKYGRIYNNVLVSNARRGIYISASDETLVYNNTIARTETRSAIEMDGMPRSGYSLTNNKIYNNIIFNDSSTNASWDMFLRLNNSATGISGNASNWNCVYRSSPPLKFTMNGSSVYSTVDDWNNASGYEADSVSGNPAFNSTSGDMFSIPSTSPAANMGTNSVSTVLTSDYMGATRQGTYDIGAYEVGSGDPPPASEQTLYTTQTPTGVSSLAVDVGMKFKPLVAGSVTGVRIYTAAAEATGIHQVRIWNSNGTLLSGPHDWSITGGTAGWKTYLLPSPVAVTAQVYYIVSVSASPGTSNKYARTAAGFNAPINSGDLRADVGAGVYTLTAGSMPTSVENNSSYFRDVTFVPGSTAQSIFTTQVPTGVSSLAVDLGTKFKALVNGSVTGVRIYTAATEATGVHQVRIWNSNGTLLSGPHDWSITGGTAGWKSFTLPTPVAITAHVYHIVSVSASPGTTSKYARTAAGFNAPISSGDLRAEIGAGVYTLNAGTMPTLTENNSNYFRDVLFAP